MLQINTMQQFQGYLTGVESRIDHHAGKVLVTLFTTGVNNA